MHRILFWRTGFELKNLQRAYLPSKKTVKYFAFGANLDPAVLLERKIKPIDEQNFVLRDYELRFCHPGPFEGMGFASIEKAPGKVTYGKLYTLTQTDAERMDFYELVPILRRYQRVSVSQDGEDFFFYQSCAPKMGLKPTKKYVESILAGFAKVTHIPETYLAELRATEVLTKMEPARDLNFLVKDTSNIPEPLANALRRYDDLAVKIFLKYFKSRSYTEGLISVV